MKQKTMLFMTLIIGLCVLLSGCSGGGSVDGVLADFDATDLSGAEVDESMLSGFELTMVNVWATFCQPCIAEMPELGELAEEYEKKGVQIVGIVSDALSSDMNIDDAQVELAREIVSQTGADYMHILPSEDLFSLLSQIASVPTTFFVDSSGNQVGGTYVGSRSGEQWRAVIESVMEEM